MNRPLSVTSTDWVCQLRWANKERASVHLNAGPDVSRCEINSIHPMDRISCSHNHCSNHIRSKRELPPFVGP